MKRAEVLPTLVMVTAFAVLFAVIGYTYFHIDSVIWAQWRGAP